VIDMHWFDLLFVFLLFVVQPIHGAFAYRNFVRKVEAGSAPDPSTIYRDTAIAEWAALLVLFVAWYWLGRPFAELGFVPAGGLGFWAGVVLLAVVCAMLLRTLRKIRAMTAEDKQRQIDALGDLAHFLPRTQRHLRHFTGLSITAGIVEEIVYRGFLLWFLGNIMPLWVAVIVSSVFFGLGHSYQGPSGALRTGLVGLAFALLYVVTGSIWLPIIGHALFDILQGRLIFDLLRGRDGLNG
jgi:membrane protease YdiL (CAAX protease family)